MDTEMQSKIRMSKSKCVNIVKVGDKVYVTIRHYGDDGYHDEIVEGSMEDVML